MRETPSETASRAGWDARVVVGAMTLALMLSGCPLGRERICRRGEHVVKSIEAPATGRTCLRDGDPPPKGYEEYPPGKVPKYTDDEGY